MSEESEARRTALHELFGGKWEYKFYSGRVTNKDNEKETVSGAQFVADVALLGEQGWEALGCVSMEGFMPSIMFKRRLVE